MGDAVREVNWAATQMGPPTSWSQSLQTALSIMLRAHYPINVYWGPQLTNFYNDAYLPIIGEKHPSALGRPLREVWPEVWDSIEPMLQAVLEDGQSFFSEDVQQFVTRSGFTEEIFMTFSYAPIYAEDGKVGGVFAAGTEVTGSVIGQRRLKLLRELTLPSSAAASPAQAARHMAGVMQEHREDLPFAAIWTPGDEAGSWQLVASSGFGDEAPPARLELSDELDRRLRGEAWIDIGHELDVAFPPGPWEETASRAVLASLTSSADSRPVGILLAGVSPRRPLDEGYRDFFSLLTEQVAHGLGTASAIAEERKRKQELEALARAKSEFLATISHEFRTPLTLILGPLDALLDQAQPEESRHLLETAQGNTLRLLRLVTNLLEYSRVQAGRLDATFRPEDLAHHTRITAALFESAFEQAGLELRVEVPEQQLEVYVDAELWEHVVSNLLSNALKFTREGRVTLSLRERDGQAELAVEDTGVGIAPDQLQRIFDPFHHHPNREGGRTREGAGIGLALVRELVTLHGGRVEVESTLGEGTRFTVKLPLDRAHLPGHLVAEAEPAPDRDTTGPYVAEAERWFSSPMSKLPEDEEAATAELMPNRPLQVLVVDDHPGMREYFHTILSPEFEVTAARDARDAEAKLQMMLPDCIVADVMMPEIDGIEFVRRVRSNHRLAQLPVILVSARTDRASRLAAFDAGADDYVQKPFDPEELRARVHRQIESLVETATRERTLRHAAETANQAKTAFLANMSHEIRTPLSTILLAANLVEELAGEEAAPHARTIHRCGERLNEMLNAVLTLARIEAGQHQAPQTPLLVWECVEEVVDTAKAHCPPEVELRLESTAAGRAARAAIDPGALSSVLHNLTSNALKFTEAGEVAVCVDVGALGASPSAPPCDDDADANAVHIHVRDTGIGIGADYLPRLFDAFSQEREGWSRGHEGSGVGMALTKRLLATANAKITVESEQGKGTHFLVSIPLADVEQATAGDAQADAATEEPSARRRILIVEDQADARELLLIVLERDYEVVGVGTAAEAREILAEQRFDAMMLDIQLPGGASGVDLMRAIRADESHRDTPLCAMTAFALPGDRERLLEAGFDRYLSKPFSPRTLRETLEEMIEASDES